ncbi:MAG: GNAT family N-acetyltransferase [Bacilli bacterium]|nr:GNAT family N-acetyltransferase [Bacilli bacterium]
MFRKIEVKYDDKETVKIFHKFYRRTLINSFEKNQIEAYRQIKKNIKEKEGSYFIILYVDDKEYPVSGIVFDYLKKTNTGFIEYIATNKRFSKKGLASKLLNETIKTLNSQAKDNGYDRINFLACEVEKEKKIKKSKHYFWKKYGFKVLDFYYLQPPLDKTKKALSKMEFGIVSKAPKAEYFFNNIDKDVIKEILEEYYEEYKNEPSLKRMLKKLDKEKIIKPKEILYED